MNLLGLGGTGRLEHRQLGVEGHPACVLLVLRGVHPGVIRDHDDEAGQNAGVGGCHQRVHRDIQPDVLARKQAAGPGDGRPESNLEGHFLVDRPLRIHLGELGQGLQNLGRGRARIGTGHTQPGLVSPICQRFIS